MLNFFRKSDPQDTEKKTVSLTDPAAWELFGAIPTGSGVTVSAHSAMRVPAVSCAVGMIAETIGALPVKVHDRDTREVAADHPAYILAHDQANDWTSAAQLREQLTCDALLNDKGGFAVVTRYPDGRPAELHRIEPSLVTLEYEDDGEPIYFVQTDRGKIRYHFTDVLHIQSFAGACPITLGREAIGLALSFERHVASVFANGARPSGIISSPKVLDVEAKKKLAGSWFSTHGGSKSGSTAILDEGMTYQQVSMTLADAQFAENRLEQIREIARVFRVPPTMLFELTRGTWSNTEEMARQFYSVTLKPWLKAWQWAYARCLLMPEERASLYLEFEVSDLLTTDAATRATAYGQYRSMGAMTGNEVRRGLNMPPLPGGDTLDNPHITTTKPESTEE